MLSFVALVLAAHIVGAQSAPVVRDPAAVQPERPTVATHAGTVALGYAEVESGVEIDNINTNTRSWITPTVLKIGVGDAQQVSIFGQLARPFGHNVGIGDVGVGIKDRLGHDLPVLGDFALLPAIKFPTGARGQGRGTGTTDLSLLAISSHDFGVVEMDVNLGLTLRSGSGAYAPREGTLWTTSFGGQFPNNTVLGWTAELYGYPGTGGAAGQSPIVALLGGPTFLIRKDLAADVGFILPVEGPQPKALYFGGAYNLGAWFAPPSRSK